jgi:hypothetical protein
MVKYGDIGGPLVTVGALSEGGDDDDMEDAESSTESVNGIDMDDLRDRFEGANMHERQSDPVSSASESASTPKAACD